MTDLQTNYAQLLALDSSWKVESVVLSLEEKRVLIQLVHGGGNDNRLTGTRQLWLFNEENLTEEAALRFELLKELELKTARAWAIKEHFRWFWSHHHKGYAKRFFDNWYAWAIRSRLKPIVKKAKMLQRHLDNLLTYVRHKITNAMAEGFNSKIQTIKTNARGFRSFDSYRIRILFYCGKLQLLPAETCHYFS